MGHHKVKSGMPQLQEKLTTHRPDLSGLSLGAKPNASAVSSCSGTDKRGPELGTAWSSAVSNQLASCCPSSQSEISLARRQKEFLLRYSDSLFLRPLSHTSQGSGPCHFPATGAGPMKSEVFCWPSLEHNPVHSGPSNSLLKRHPWTLDNTANCLHWTLVCSELGRPNGQLFSALRWRRCLPGDFGRRRKELIRRLQAEGLLMKCHHLSVSLK